MNSSSPLFREEALTAASHRLGGGILLHHPRSFTYGMLLAAGTVLAITGLLATAEYARRHTVPGFVLPSAGLLKVVVPRSGQIEHVYIQEGSSVQAGQQLAQISVEAGYADSLGITAPERIAAELAKQEQNLVKSLERDAESVTAEDKRLRRKVVGLERELHALHSDIKAHVRQKDSTGVTLSKLEQLHAKGYLTDFELSLRKEQLFALEREGHVLERAIAVTETSLVEAQLQLEQLPLQGKQRRASIENQLSEIRRQGAALETERSYVITAPISGQVTALQVEAGKTVAAGQPLMSILAGTYVLEAHLIVLPQAAGFIKPGQKVRLRYSAFPYQQYGVYSALVKDISHTTLRPDEWPTGLPIPGPVYRVRATLERQYISARGERRPLQPGMLLEADILQEPRPLWSWLLEPLLAFRGRA